MNGCSFTDIWKPSDDFVKALGCDKVVNLGIEATSFQRTVRSSIEWIAQNGKPKFVLAPITFSHRWELALNLHDDPIEGSWIPLQNSNFIRDDIKLQGTNAKDLKKLIDDYYKIIPNVKTYYDKLFTDIILFANYLENNGIRYLMFDMCNNFDKKHIQDILNERFTWRDLVVKDKIPNEGKSLKTIILDMEDEVLANAGVDVFEEVFKLIFTKLWDEMKSKEDKSFLDRLLNQSVKENYADYESRQQAAQDIDDEGFRV